MNSLEDEFTEDEFTEDELVEDEFTVARKFRLEKVSSAPRICIKHSRRYVAETPVIPLSVIGKSAKPRCFKNEKGPVNYEANKKAWMTGVIFKSQLKRGDRNLKKDGRKVLLYLDNCSAHSKPSLDNITLKFFPPNTTEMSQPMDQGVIQNLKVHYRKLVLCW